MTGNNTLYPLIVAACLAVTAAAQTSSSTADTILYNAKIWTVDPAQPRAEAVAIAGSKIVKVGSNAEILTLKDSHTHAVDLHGASVLPGFEDAHTHFENATQWFFETRLIDVDNEREMLDRLAETARRVPASMWITAIDMDGFAGWAAEKKGDKSFQPLQPDLAEVDAASGDHPVLLKRYDGAAFANSKALKIARVDENTPDPKGGRYGKDAKTGKLNGMLYGKAAQDMAAILPPFNMASKLVGARGILRQMNAYGITSIHDIARLDAISQKQIYPSNVERSYSDVDIFRNLEKAGELTVRVYAYMPLRSWSELAANGVHPGSGDDFVRYGILKEFADKGWMLRPYDNHPKYSGDVTYRFTTEEDERNLVLAADKAGYDIGIHTIGDKALHMVLDWYQDAIRVNGSRPDRRFRIIHMWYATPEEIKRAGAMHLIVDVTPFHFLNDVDAIDRAVGPERARTAFAYRSMIDSGMRLNIVSDMPGAFSRMDVSPYNPLENIYYAVTRETLSGQPVGGWHPEQRITVKEAVEAYTINPAYSSHEEEVKGSITAGKLADMVVLSNDILSIDPKEIPQTKVLATMLGGKIVYGKLP